jgi:ATP-binding cassette, subfamily F, member 2
VWRLLVQTVRLALIHGSRKPLSSLTLIYRSYPFLVGAGKTTLIKLITDELQPTKGQVKRNTHLRISRFTQHFEDKLDLNMTPLDFFKQKVMPEKTIEQIRPLLARYGCSGDQQTQVMNQLSAGQKARIVFSLICNEKVSCHNVSSLVVFASGNLLTISCWNLSRRVQPHLLLLDEPTNPLDICSIDALAACLRKFKGGVLMISHDMRLISQCAQEIYICDNKSITKFAGDILKFKMKTKAENSKKLAQHMNG